MILGIGLDIMDPSRMRDKIQNRGFLERFLHPEELKTIDESNEDKSMLCASRFCVKEAFGKALGTGLRGLKLQDIELVHDASGRPEIVLHGTAKAAFIRLGGSQLFVSISHEEHVVAASVIIEGDLRQCQTQHQKDE